jgi:hypothetical protein
MESFRPPILLFSIEINIVGSNVDVAPFFKILEGIVGGEKN